MQHTIEDTLLSANDRQTLAKLLANFYAALSDQQERDLQASLRGLANTRPDPDPAVLAGVEADKTLYVPAKRGIRRTVAVTPPPIETGQEAPPKAEAIPSGVHPVVEAPP